MKKQLPLRKGNELLFTVLLCICSIILHTQSEAQILYTQDTTVYGNVISYQDFEAGGQAFTQSADDFEVPVGQSWQITHVSVPGVTVPAPTSSYVYSADVVIFADDHGKPGEQIYHSDYIPSSSGIGNSNLEIILPAPLNLESGIYWISVLGIINDYYPSERWHWKTTEIIRRNVVHYRDTYELHNTRGDWAPLHTVSTSPPVDLLFTLYGTATGTAAPASPSNLIVRYHDNAFDLSWQDNSNDENTFVIEHSTDGENFDLVRTLSMNDTSYTHRDPFYSTERYYYRVGARSTTGLIAYSYPSFDDISEPLYAQNKVGIGGISSSQEYDSEIVLSADDFVVPEDQSWKLKEINVTGSFNTSSLGIRNGHVIIFADSAGYPTKNELYSSGGIRIPLEQVDNPNMKLVLPEIVDLAPGRYWVSVYAEFYEEGEYWDWIGTSQITGSLAHMWTKNKYSPSDNEWQPSHEIYGPGDPIDLIFTLLGTPVYSEEQTLHIQDTPVYGNSTSYRDFDYGWTLAQSADDFEVPGGQHWVVTRIHAPGIPYPDRPDIYSFGGEVLIYVDDNGKPGELIYSSGLLPPGTSNADLDLTLPTPASLEAGVYWISLLGQSSQWFPEEKWHWKTTDLVSGNTAYLRNSIPIDINITQGDWAPLYKAIPQPPVDLLFTLFGVSAGDAAPAAPRDLAVNYTAPAFILTWADNADDETGYLIERGTDGQSFNAIATVGPDITTYEDNDTFDHTLRYHYRIAALDSALKSNYSHVVFVDVADTLQTQPYEGGGSMSSSQEMRWETTISADDFRVPENQSWTLKKIYTKGNSSMGIHIQKAHVKIFIDSAGFPTKNELYSTSISLPYEDRSKENMMLTLPEPVSLPSGSYWFSVYVQFYERETGNEVYWYWTATDSIQGTQAQIWVDYPEPESNWNPAFEATDAAEGPFDLVFTLFGIDTHMPQDSLTLEAPVANLASFVSATSFTANWQPVENATHYELDVFNIQDSVSLPGYENKIVNGTSQEVTGTKSYRRYFYVVRAVNDTIASENSNAIRVAHIKNLTLRTVCSDTPTVYRRWKVINNNPFPIEVTWNVLNTAQSGTHLADIGESFFTTETVSGLNKTMIAWYDDEQVQHISIKSSTYTPCQSDKVSASGRRDLEVDLEEGDSPFMVAAYPNPVKDKLTILLSTPLEGMVNIEIVNMNGQRLYAKELLGNTIQEIDASSFAPGLFILKAKQGRYQRAIKIVKQ